MAAKKKSNPKSATKKKSKSRKQTAKPPHSGAAVAIEEGERVEGAKRLDPVVNADAATGELIDPEGSIQAQKVTG
jgi:hypothetical protein